MAEPTLKDVLDAIAEMRSETKADLAQLRSETKADLAQVRNEMATKGELAKVEAKVETVSAKVDAHRAETAKGFATLDKELEGHSGVIHREIEARLDKVEARLPAPRPAARAPRRR